MSVNINGYIADGFTMKNAGFCEWSHAVKDGHDYFIKRFLSPVYPVDTTIYTPEIVQKKREQCMKYAQNRNRVYKEINKGDTGNIVKIIDFFRFETKFYLVTEWVEDEKIPVERIAAMDFKQKLVLCRIIVNNVRTLHRNGVVHADIKHDNMLIKQTTSGKYTAKLMDFDASFMEDTPPEQSEDIPFTPAYVAPETILYSMEECEVIDCKIDVFALGILLHEYLTGFSPRVSEDYETVCDAVMDGQFVTADISIPTHIGNIINKMLLENPEDRPTLDEVFEGLTEIPNIGLSEAQTNNSKSKRKSYFHAPGTDDLL